MSQEVQNQKKAEDEKALRMRCVEIAAGRQEHDGSDIIMIAEKIYDFITGKAE